MTRLLAKVLHGVCLYVHLRGNPTPSFLCSPHPPFPPWPPQVSSHALVSSPELGFKGWQKARPPFW